MVWQKSKKVSYHKQIERQQDRATMNAGQDEAWATATLLEVSSHLVCLLFVVLCRACTSPKMLGDAWGPNLGRGRPSRNTILPVQFGLSRSNRVCVSSESKLCMAPAP